MRDDDPFFAFVVPDGVAPVEVFSSAGIPDDGNPFDFTYQQVVAAGTVTVNCCTVPAVRELERSGRGRWGYFSRRSLDMGLAIDSSPDAACADLPVIGPNRAVIRPWLRVLPDPDPDLAGGELAVDYNDPNFLATLNWGVCHVESTVENFGVALTAEDAEDLVGYAVDCEEPDLPFRPVTAGVSLDPTELDEPFVRPWTAECNRSRSARRSSSLLYFVNARVDTDQNGPVSTINRLMSDLRDEIEAAPGVCVELTAAITGDLLDQWAVAKDAINNAKRDSALILSSAVPEIDDLTLLALDTIPQCTGNPNPKGLIAGRSMNASYMTCSYLGHPDSIALSDCPIDPAVLAEIGIP